MINGVSPQHRNRMDREITQSLAEIKRQFEISKMQKLQEQVHSMQTH